MRRVLAMTAALLLAGAANATTYLLSWSGSETRNVGRGVTLTASGTGSGSLTIKDGVPLTGTVADLVDFSFTTDITESASMGFGPPTLSPAGTTYGLADLSVFDARPLSGFLFTAAKFGRSGGTETFRGFQDQTSYDDLRTIAPGGLLTAAKQADPSAVPEPATWMAMLIGFALVGFVQRRRELAA